MNNKNMNETKNTSPVEGKSGIKAKTLDNISTEKALSKANDIKVFGDGNMFKLLCKASSESEGWMKSTKAMEIQDVGCVVQVTTQQRQPSGGYAIDEAVTFVPNATIIELKDENGIVTGRQLVRNSRAI